jgi:cyclopropane fatty-acyl-phospholipid synthase-like methyltransferase
MPDVDYKAVYAAQFKVPKYARNRIAPDHDFALSRLPAEGSLLDIGSGAGSFVRKALARFPGLKVTTADLDKFHDLELPFVAVDLSKPSSCVAFCFQKWDYVTCLGVLEHLAEDKVPGALEAIARASRDSQVILTVANHEDKGVGGVDLHLTLQPADWWRERVSKHFEVTYEVGYARGRGHCFACVLKG